MRSVQHSHTERKIACAVLPTRFCFFLKRECAQPNLCLSTAPPPPNLLVNVFCFLFHSCFLSICDSQVQCSLTVSFSARLGLAVPSHLTVFVFVRCRGLYDAMWYKTPSGTQAVSLSLCHPSDGRTASVRPIWHGTP